MALEKIRLVPGDTRPALTVTLSDTTDGQPINITGCTVRLKFREAGAAAVRSTLIGSVTDGPAGGVVFFWADDPQSLAGEPGD